ncbi:hypothetical protein MMC21_002171 [Puttea exsequens]|nr:hypothetical protein [Puttea exsequens]
MEHPSKRRRVERSSNRPTGETGVQLGRSRSGSLTEKKEREGFVIPKLVLPSLKDRAFDVLLRLPQQKLHDIFAPAKLSGDEDRELRARELEPRQPNSNVQINQNIPAAVNNVVQPVAQPTTTVVAVAISNGKEILSNVVEPYVTTPIVIPGVGELNMAPTPPPVVDPSPQTPEKAPPDPGDVVPPAAVAASVARAEALATQQAIAHQYNALPQAPAATHNAKPEHRLVASQGAVAIKEAGSSAQQVLSSPPTPLPPTPEPSEGPVGSYFSSPSPPKPNPSVAPFNALNPPLPTPNTNNQPHRSSNSTTPTTSMSGTAASASMSISSLDSAASVAFLAEMSASQASVNSLSAMNRLSSGFATSTQSSSTSEFISLSASSSTSLSSAASSSSTGASSSVIGPGIVGGPTATGSPSASTSTSSGGSGGGGIPPTTQKLVGGIIGGCAGIALILFAILFFFRWRRNRMTARRNISPPIPLTLAPGGPGTMTQRSSTAPIAAAGLLGRLRPASSQTAGTVTSSSTGPSEKGFQKISGRKLPSVLASGGDGYGDARGTTGPSRPPGAGGRSLTPGQGPHAGLGPGLRPSPPHSLSGSSFYRDSHGFYGGVAPTSANDAADTTENSSSPSPQFSAPLAVAGRGATGELPNIRPSPARTPVIHQPGQVPMRTPSRPTPPSRPTRNTPPPIISDFPRPPRDGLGRSHPSQDGSRGSRFREDTTPP